MYLPLLNDALTTLSEFRMVVADRRHVSAVELIASLAAGRND